MKKSGRECLSTNSERGNLLFRLLTFSLCFLPNLSQSWLYGHPQTQLARVFTRIPFQRSPCLKEAQSKSCQPVASIVSHQFFFWSFDRLCFSFSLFPVPFSILRFHFDPIWGAGPRCTSAQQTHIYALSLSVCTSTQICRHQIVYSSRLVCLFPLTWYKCNARWINLSNSYTSISIT